MSTQRRKALLWASTGSPLVKLDSFHSSPSHHNLLYSCIYFRWSHSQGFADSWMCICSCVLCVLPVFSMKCACVSVNRTYCLGQRCHWAEILDQQPGRPDRRWAHLLLQPSLCSLSVEPDWAEHSPLPVKKRERVSSSVSRYMCFFNFMKPKFHLHSWHFIWPIHCFGKTLIGSYFVLKHQGRSETSLKGECSAVHWDFILCHIRLTCLWIINHLFLTLSENTFSFQSK